MTLNLQYFANYPKDEAAATQRLREELQGESPPDVICVQEGLQGRDVLKEVGFDLKVCSAEKGKAQTVHEMVYGDKPTLNACDSDCHNRPLCNQIYIRREGSPWTIQDSGCEQISRNLDLEGGHERFTGSLAIRSMVWVRLQHNNLPNLTVFVLCAHISGGRFEDQYFVQKLAEERRLQVHRVIDFFNNRENPQDDDVGILVGDFNATSVYTETGPMHAYYKASIASSKGVKADAMAANVDDKELEKLFQTYMISPFQEITTHKWTFAYDRHKVDYTSGFGHCIDHMAMNRPLQVKGTRVSYLTNRRFGNGPEKCRLPLTDHNAVTSVFMIQGKDDTSKVSVFRTEYDFLQHLKEFKALVHIGGFGAQQQYEDPEKVIAETGKVLFEGERSLDEVYGKGKWAACYGGDKLNVQTPDVAVLVNRLRQNHKMHLIAIQAEVVESDFGGVGTHVDAVYYYPTDFTEDGQIAWGGWDEKAKKTVGTTRILLEVNPLCGLPLYWVAAGGGQITAHELEVAWAQDIRIWYTEAKARYPQDKSNPFGPCKRFWEEKASKEFVEDEAKPFRKKLK